MFYATQFLGNENPISEGGKWAKRGLADGLDWTDPRTDGTGRAFGTQTIHATPPFDDSIAHLSGFATTHQVVMATMLNNMGANASDFEVELFVFFTIGAHSAQGYEFDIINKGNGLASVDLVQWNGALNNFTIVAGWTQLNNVAVATGHVVAASANGTILKFFSDGVLLETYDTTGDTGQITAGQPGMGFWNAGGDVVGNIGKFAFSYYAADDGLNEAPYNPWPQRGPVQAHRRFDSEPDGNGFSRVASIQDARLARMRRIARRDAGKSAWGRSEGGILLRNSA